MHFQMLRKRGAASSEALVKQQRVLMDEPKRDKFGEASGFILNITQEAHLPHPVLRRFRVSVHHGRSRTNAESMRGADHLDPLRGGELVARKNLANFVVENFRCGAWQRTESIVAKHRKIVVD